LSEVSGRLISGEVGLRYLLPTHQTFHKSSGKGDNHSLTCTTHVFYKQALLTTPLSHAVVSFTADGRWSCSGELRTRGCRAVCGALLSTLRGRIASAPPVGGKNHIFSTHHAFFMTH